MPAYIKVHKSSFKKVIIPQFYENGIAKLAGSNIRNLFINPNKYVSVANYLS